MAACTQHTEFFHTCGHVLITTEHAPHCLLGVHLQENTPAPPALRCPLISTSISYTHSRCPDCRQGISHRHLPDELALLRMDYDQRLRAHLNRQYEDEMIRQAEEEDAEEERAQRERERVVPGTREQWLEEHEQLRLALEDAGAPLSEQTFVHLTDTADSVFLSRVASEPNTDPSPDTDPSSPEDDICGICREVMLPSSEDIRRLPCRHIFHMACISPWIEQGEGHPTCPMCRQEYRVASVPMFDGVPIRLPILLAHRYLTLRDTLRDLGI